MSLLWTEDDLHEGDIVWITDPIAGERLAKIAALFPGARTGKLFFLKVQRRYAGAWKDNSRGDLWGPPERIEPSDVLRVEVRV